MQDTVYSLGQIEKKHQIFRIENVTIALLISSSNPLSTFTMANQNKLYYSQIRSTSDDSLKKTLEEGYIYRWGQDNVINIADKRYEHYEFEEVWCLDIRSQEKQFLTKFDFKNFIDHRSLITLMELSPDENKLAININRLGNQELGAPSFCKDVVIFDIQKNKSYNLLVENQITIKVKPCWINNNELVIMEENYVNKEFKFWLWSNLSNKINQLDFNVGHQRPTSIVWNSEKNLLLVTTNKILYSISITKNTMDESKLPENLLPENYWEECSSFDNNLHFLATAFEDAKTPPQVVIYDLKSNKMITLTALNPDIENITLGKIEQITVKTKDDISTQGFLIYPVDYKPKNLYPLIIGTYGFNGQRYALNAEEWHSSFPAQIFAKEGYFVLLLNVPRDTSQLMVNASKMAREECGWHKLKVFEQAVTMLTDKKLIDANKVGLYGWSHGAFVVEFLITHSNKFHVASIGEGGDYNPGEFWLAGHNPHIA